MNQVLLFPLVSGDPEQFARFPVGIDPEFIVFVADHAIVVVQRRLHASVTSHCAYLAHIRHRERLRRIALVVTVLARGASE